MDVLIASVYGAETRKMSVMEESEKMSEEER